MAYNFQDIDPESMDFRQQSEDARKKRMLLAASLATGGAIPESIGQYAGQRMDQAVNTLTNPTQAIQDKFAGLTQQPQGPAGPVMPQEIAQQRAPIAGQTPQEQQLTTPQFQAQQTQPQMGPVSPEQLQQPVQQTQLPQAGEGVQVAGPMTTPPAQTQPVTKTNWMDDLSKVGTDPQALATFMSKTDIPEARNAAGRMIAQQYNQQQKEQAAAAETNKAFQSGDLLPLMKRIQQEKGEGSYVKAYLYQRLGLTDLAKDEQQKLGAGTTFQVAYDPSGNKALMEVTAQGLPIKGYNDKMQELTPEEFGKFAVGQQPKHAFQMPSVHGSPVTNAQGETGLMIYDPITRQNYVQVGNEKRSTAGWTTMAQNVQNVYGQAQAQKLGAGAGEGFAPTPMRPLPGSVPQVQPGMAAGAQPQPQVQPGVAAQPQVQSNVPGGGATPQQRIEGDIAGLQREIANTPNIPANQGRLAILRQELEKVRTQTTQPAAQTGVPGGGIAQQKANLEIEQSRIKEEQKPAAEAKGKETAASIKKQAFADNAYPIVKELGSIIKESTGSGIGASVDDLAAAIGKSPKGAQAIAKLETFASPLVSMVPRFEGSQSDRDVQMYQKQAGDFANPKLPVATRLAALQGMVKLLQIYDKEGANDWGAISGQQEKTIGGVTYVYDGKGWKPKK